MLEQVPVAKACHLFAELAPANGCEKPSAAGGNIHRPRPRDGERPKRPNRPVVDQMEFLCRFSKRSF
jgi:hypothetical protein